jgi:hypothetical protein
MKLMPITGIAETQEAVESKAVLISVNRLRSLLT